MKKYKIMFWVATIIIFLGEGIIPIATMHSAMSIQGITSLGYPVYFVTMLSILKFIGALMLIIPQVSGRIKEWAYAGFGIDFLCAFISIWVVFGFGGMVVLPLVAMALLVISYMSYHKIKARA